MVLRARACGIPGPSTSGRVRDVRGRRDDRSVEVPAILRSATGATRPEGAVDPPPLCFPESRATRWSVWLGSGVVGVGRSARARRVRQSQPTLTASRISSFPARHARRIDARNPRTHAATNKSTRRSVGKLRIAVLAGRIRTAAAPNAMPRPTPRIPPKTSGVHVTAQRSWVPVHAGLGPHD